MRVWELQEKTISQNLSSGEYINMSRQFTPNLTKRRECNVRVRSPEPSVKYKLNSKPPRDLAHLISARCAYKCDPALIHRRGVVIYIIRDVHSN